MAFTPRDLLYRAYARRLESEVREGESVPRHVGVILDGNRRWARAMGFTSAAAGHRRGAQKIDELVEWCQDLGIPVLTLWLLSTDNLEREPEELDELLQVIEEKVSDLAAAGRWRVRALGALELLPERTREVLERAASRSRDGDGPILNFAVGYGGRQEIADATRRLLESYAAEGADLGEAAKRVTPDEISRFLYTAGLPDPDLIIRTSGEVRLSGFLLWQSAHSEYYFCDAYWPDFRRIDFLRAVRDYQQRHRRFGR
ncbi:MAG TPA: isoprenyl transferase [Actinomycetota bacterium]|nr:isoprenyl transferase [Actinomycetota bacterium]